MQSSLQTDRLHHVAIIPDGNGRWAASKGLPRSAGHRAGAQAVREVVEAATKAEIDVLTLFAFSADNWQRPQQEVAALMDLFERYLAGETAHCRDKGVRLNFIGRRCRLRPRLLTAIEHAEETTRAGQALLFRIAVDYSARQAITRAAAIAAAAGEPPCDGEAFETALLSSSHSVPDVPAVDLLIRTSGETRLSDFLLWECAYAELHFTSVLWPDFTGRNLENALADYHRRERRFGRIPLLKTAGSPW
ncbi:MAG: polyprenyl diphosphate synthase [Acidobacteriota bacterium]|nr:polyprenyl diphosphate synthase [Acidobacteriota bacterium]